MGSTLQFLFSVEGRGLLAELYDGSFPDGIY